MLIEFRSGSRNIGFGALKLQYDEETSVVYRDETHESLGRTLSATTDPYVLSFGAVALVGGGVIRRPARSAWPGALGA